MAAAAAAAAGEGRDVLVRENIPGVWYVDNDCCSFSGVLEIFLKFMLINAMP